MSDIIWAALLAVIGSGIAGFIAYLGTIRNAQEQTRREANRLRDEHRESDRRVRREAYTSYLGCVERLDAMVSMYARPAERNHWESWLLEFRAAQVAVRLVESQSVLKARQRFGKLLLDLAHDVEKGFDAGSPSAGRPWCALHAYP